MFTSAWHETLALSLAVACTTLRNKLGCWGPDASACGLSVRCLLVPPVGQQHMLPRKPSASVASRRLIFVLHDSLEVGHPPIAGNLQHAAGLASHGPAGLSACMPCPRTVTAGPCQYSGDALHTQQPFHSFTVAHALKWELVDSAATSFPCRVWAAVACMGSGLAASVWARLCVCNGVIEWTAPL